MVHRVGIDRAPVSASALRAEECTVLLELASLAHWCTIGLWRWFTVSASTGHQ
jgi:hypothetical protein